MSKQFLIEEITYCLEELGELGQHPRNNLDDPDNYVVAEALDDLESKVNNLGELIAELKEVLDDEE